MPLIRPNERKPDSVGLIRDAASRDFTALEIMNKSSMKLYGKRNISQTLLGSATRDPRLTDFRVVLRSLAYAWTSARKTAMTTMLPIVPKHRYFAENASVVGGIDEGIAPNSLTLAC
ncbi:hypothetical protein WS84_23380 [Burkholderia anthina]|nr:hypothetical protein WS84_23380 [Burkholderia anthina]KVH08459.1 hypothetical protein WS85_21650 [Burkholderia anthina]KVM91134.1 hypothetical protein WT06_15260 [Burkholderia anthina]KVX30891.1 hypothetical protein WT32_25895 [Burkholderia anthina]